MDMLNGIMDISCECLCSTDKGFTQSVLQVL